MGKRRPSGDGMVRGREDGRWEGRIVVGHKANGDSIFRYFSAGSQRELMRKLHREQEVYQGVDLTEECRITLAEWLDRWMETYMEGAVRASTLRGMRHDVERHIKPRLGETIISEISQADVQSLYAALLENGRVHPHPELGTGLSASTIRKIHGILHGALKAANQARLIPRDPTEGVTLPPVERPPQQILTRRETDRFLRTAKADGVWYPLFYTALSTGLRKGELCGLRWEDFDPEAGMLLVRRTLRREPGGILTTGETKTYAGTRKLLLPESTAELLQQQQAQAVSPWMFPNPLQPEVPISPNRASYQLRRLLKKAGLPQIRFHDLRHTFATHALSDGVDAKTLSGILGHTNASFTLDTYTHVTGEMQQQAADIVGAFLTETFGKKLKSWQRAAST